MQERASSSANQYLPYKFTGKELDPETGLYYFGARYYDAKVSRWISADPALGSGKYFPKPSDFDTEHDYFWYLENDKTHKMPGIGGVFNAINLNAYHYAGQNPVKLVDPDGNDIILLNKSGGAFGYGHNAVLVGNDKTGWVYFSKDGARGKDSHAEKFKSLDAFIKVNKSENNGLNNYDRAYRVSTSEEADYKMATEGYKIHDRDYSFAEKVDDNGNVISQNCSDLAADIGKAGGVNISKPKMDSPVGKITKPNEQYLNFIKNNKGESLDIKRALSPKG